VISWRTVALFAAAGFLAFIADMAPTYLGDSALHHHPPAGFGFSGWFELGFIACVVAFAAWFASGPAGALLNVTAFYASFELLTTLHAVARNLPIGHDVSPLTTDHGVIVAVRLSILVVLTLGVWVARRLTRRCS
jgi:hypothetical protein